MLVAVACGRLDLHQRVCSAQNVYSGCRGLTGANVDTVAQVTQVARRDAPLAPLARPLGAGTASSLSIAIAGSGGSGVMTAGTLLLEAAAKADLYGLMVRTSGPQIRGGEAAALVRLADREVGSLGDGFDLLIAIDWQNVNRFADEIALGATSVVIGDADEGEMPDV